MLDNHSSWTHLPGRVEGISFWDNIFQPKHDVNLNTLNFRIVFNYQALILINIMILSSSRRDAELNKEEGKTIASFDTFFWKPREPCRAREIQTDDNETYGEDFSFGFIGTTKKASSTTIIWESGLAFDW